MVDSRMESERGLGARLGPYLFARAAIRDGYDGSGPVVSASVIDAVDDMRAQIAADPRSPFARGLNVVIEQRFAD